MAERAANFAESLGVEHVTTKIPWGEGVYPPKPTSGDKVELLARDARYALFFAAMQDARISTLALAHHADDQVETMLMRLGKGTTTLGMVGMRPRSRLGMGTDLEGGLNWRGHLGLQMFKIRPLLDVGKVIFFIYKIPMESVIIDFLFLSKDRILATCEENKLEYVNDPSNFQPHFTIRNAIRHCLDTEEGKDSTFKTEDPTFSNYPNEIAVELKKINKAASKYPELRISLSAGRERLREAVKTVAEELEQIDATGLFFILK
jgi:tRNA(Ile)-lysidine synthase